MESIQAAIELQDNFTGALYQIIDSWSPAPIVLPVQWQSGGLEVFTNAGAERFEQEAQSTNALLERLSAAQDAIAKRAYNTHVLPPEAFQELNRMAVRIDLVRNRIQQFELF